MDTLRTKKRAGTLQWDVRAPEPDATQETMAMSQNGHDELLQYEGSGANPYQDSSGYRTIGHGHLIDTSRDGRISAAEWKAYDALGYPRNTLGDEQQMELYKDDVQPRVDAVNAMLKAAVTQEIFDALVSLSFNIGVGKAGDPKKKGLINSPVLAAVNEGRFDDLPASFPQYVNSGGRYSKGLENHRMREVTTFATPHQGAADAGPAGPLGSTGPGQPVSRHLRRQHAPDRRLRAGHVATG